MIPLMWEPELRAHLPEHTADGGIGLLRRGLGRGNATTSTTLYLDERFIKKAKLTFA